MTTAAQIHSARKNDDHRNQRRHAGIEVTSVDEVIRLPTIASTGAHPAVRNSANRLLRMMSDWIWTIGAGPHRGGADDNLNPDRNLHITIFVDGAGYHLQLAPSGLVRRITSRKDPDVDLVPPYVPPGAAPPAL